MTAPPATIPVPSPARTVTRQAVFDLRLLLRNGEQFILTLAIPVILLLGLSRTELVTVGDSGQPRIDVVTPGIIALAVLSTAFTALAIATGFDRRGGVLKFLGATPLQRSGLVTAKALTTLAVVSLQMLVIIPLALFLGWGPAGSLAAALLLVALGAVAFAAWGMTLAGLLRAEATLAAANAIYVLLLLGGGVVIPLEVLPAPVAAVAQFLPTGALGEGLRAVLTDGAALPWAAVAVLTAWAAAGLALASRTFRWE